MSAQLEERLRYKPFVGDWTDFLIPFFLSPEYTAISYTLKKLSKTGKTAPIATEVFRAFKECSFTNVNTIFIDPDIYNSMLPNDCCQADGLCYSSKNAPFIPRLLNTVLNAVDEDVYDGLGFHLSNSTDLKHWANQGVLLLNSALTTTIGKEAHYAIWATFIEYLLSKLSNDKSDLVLVLLGEPCWKLENYVTNPTWKVFKLESPYESLVRNKLWNHENVFTEINKFHTKNNIKIKW